MSERQPQHLSDQLPQKEPLNLGRQIVIFMGPEGSGKSTIAKKLAEETGKPRIAIGDILRGAARDPEAKYHEQCRKMFEEHAYMNPSILMDILVERFKEDDIADGFILDGGMRTMEEAQGFQSVLERSNKTDMSITPVYLRIPGWMSFERLVTGVDARQRDDDTIDGVLKRLSNHYKNLGQRSSFIRRQENWEPLNINAMGSVEETYKNVHKALGGRGY